MIDPTAAPISVIFDTRCMLCSRWVRFLLRHEADRRLHFVGAWSPTGLEMAARYGFRLQDLQKTYLVIIEGVALDRSDAGLALLGHMKPPWRWLRLLRIVPRPLRDLVYDVVARNRYRWFGTIDTCLMPDPALRDRFTLE
ncbi:MULTISPECIES: DCC1-like thiol-disulfide oxidoreductase family protein [unclassified Methylobacterium]|uniref:thiol-disulfide oxidoreductase DCC family protein n=1 Tax=unclassified Methylobacterium TaxID=2615210 RepID=UPI00164F5F81|nr:MULTISPECIES: DCC1-like thiol-disulfide oxidoreductase family protein [unclassified Methylobacterium]